MQRIQIVFKAPGALLADVIGELGTGAWYGFSDTKSLLCMVLLARQKTKVDSVPAKMEALIENPYGIDSPRFAKRNTMYGFRSG